MVARCRDFKVVAKGAFHSMSCVGMFGEFWNIYEWLRILTCLDWLRVVEFYSAMGRRRVLVLAPAITRMQCMSNPYKRVEGGGDKAPEKEPPSTVVRRTSSLSFWSSWRKKKAAGHGKKRSGAPRRRGFRVTKLRIRMLSPLFWLKKVRDAYVDMMLAIEHSSPREHTHSSSRDCGGMVTYPAYMHQSQNGGPWIFPTFAPPVVF